MLRSIVSCASVPALYLRSKREAPSAATVAAIFRATVSGEPTYSDPAAISLLELRPAGRGPAALGADPVPHDLDSAGQSSSRAWASVSATWPGEWTPTGSVRLTELGEGAVVELDVGREAARVAADDGEREREAVARRADHRLGAAADADPGA